MGGEHPEPRLILQHSTGLSPHCSQQPLRAWDRQPQVQKKEAAAASAGSEAGALW